VKTIGKRTCPVCGTLFPDDSESCPVCALRTALEPQSDSRSGSSPELRFEHYTVLKNADGTPLELGRGAMGVTYKAFDVHLQCPVALKIINARLIGDSSGRLRFVREARAAASVRHPNVAWVTHLGESGGNYFYVMEFVEGETVEKLVQRSGRLEPALALQIFEQVAAGLTAIHKQHLVHRDIKPSNIMVSWDQGRLENVKIIDLGLAKGVVDEGTISTAGSFTGTPSYASPEQFAGIGGDIRSDLYSLGITLWEMLSGKPPFQGSAVELMHLHQHAAVPIEKLKGVPAPIIALLEILLAKDPCQRFPGPAQLQTALLKVREAVGSGLRLTANDLRSIGDQATEQSKGMRQKSGRHRLRWLAVSGLCLSGLLLGWFYFSGNRGPYLNPRGVEAMRAEKSIAVLPFESLSATKDDVYFADGVQDEILNNLAKIAQLKVISRTSVMQYRADNKRDLRQIANALGVANVLEGTVRRDGNHVRVSTDLVDARNDHTIWADSYDRDLTDIFAIQSEVAQTIVRKLNATLSPEEKRSIEAKPTDNLEAYDLYLRANQLIMDASASLLAGDIERPLGEAIGFLEQAVQLDPKFTLAYCAAGLAHDLLYYYPDATPERRALADAAINSALRLQPDLPEVHLAYAYHLYYGYQDYEQGRAQLAIAKRSLPNDVRAIALQAYIDRQQGNFEKAIQLLREAIRLDPRNKVPLQELADTLYETRQFNAEEQIFDRLQEISPDDPDLRVARGADMLDKTGDITALRSAIAALPASTADGRNALTWRLFIAVLDRDWVQSKEIIKKMKGGEDLGLFAAGWWPVPVGCYSILIARLQGEPAGADPSFAEVREQMNQKIQKSPQNGAFLLSQLAVVDALLDKKEAAVSEAKRAVQLFPISKDALRGPRNLINLAVVYAWTNEPDLAFATLDSVTKTPFGIYYGELKLNPIWEPLRKDPRFDKLLAELAPRD
jgi:serine/threonine protein kinase/tetratricopeptide (TPR) repeat protein